MLYRIDFLYLILVEEFELFVRGIVDQKLLRYTSALKTFESLVSFLAGWWILYNILEKVILAIFQRKSLIINLHSALSRLSEH